MSKRHDMIGIKQTLCHEWMQKAVDLLLAGLDAKAMRQELHEFLAAGRGRGWRGMRSQQTRTFVVNNLMKIWVSPDLELQALRNAALAYLREHPSTGVAIHWAMISAVYPFWFNVAGQTGRLLKLQDKVTQTQIITRLKEHYGDRQTVSRYARFVIRSLVAWGVLRDTKTKGCYGAGDVIKIDDPELQALLLESALWAIPDGKRSLNNLLDCPSFFPFQWQTLAGAQIGQCTKRIDVTHYGLDKELLSVQ